MILHLVRHGETVWHQENRYAGVSDIDLTPLGVEQALTLAGWARTARLDAIVSSDLSRSIKTATPSAKACDLELLIEPRFREVNFGLGEGMTKSEMESDFLEEYLSFIREPADVPLTNGEIGSKAVARAAEALNDLLEAQELKRVLLVSHATLSRLLICALTGIPLNNYRRVLPEMINAAVTTLNVPKVSAVSEIFGSASLLEFNRPI
jgi:probable phosphoglycerate mutase